MTSETYRAVQAIGGGKLELVERAVPEPGAGKVRIRVEACGICHTDALTIEGSIPGLPYPRVPGHEVVGRIDALGEGVIGWTLGQRVGVGFLGGNCGRCAACRSGDLVNCSKQAWSGIHYDGGYAEVMIADQYGLAAVPDELGAAEAAPLLCAGVTTFNALRNAPARPGDLVAIHGIGGLGHLGVQFARRMGFRTVAIARGAEKAELAKALGAHHYIDSAAQDPAKALQALGGAKIIIATVSSPAAMAPLVPGLGRKGQMVVLGVGAEAIPVSAMVLVTAERSIAGSSSGVSIDSEDTMNFAVLQDIKATIETVPLEQAAEAYAKMMRNEARFRIVLTMGA